jgi:Histidine kinase-like ATPase domain
LHDARFYYSRPLFAYMDKFPTREMVMHHSSSSNAFTGLAPYRTEAPTHEPDQNGWCTWDSNTTAAFPVIDAVNRVMAAQAYPPGDAFAVRLALEEALGNAIKHGNANDPSKRIQVRTA